MTISDENVSYVSLAEVKNLLRKVEKERETLLYEQRIALEHAQNFVKLPANKTEELIKKLMKLEKVKEIHAYKIADLLPTTKEKVQSIFAKERINITDKDIKEILDLVNEYYIE
ncbi:MAG: RNA polymerase Rpb4 [Candidatus Thermoplasmatota archaeon]|nr:RNA polymerase Rpb4 [Candidatus Thermoplasmatota archaeon]MBS3801854.1 RNA polymerase Rpb4 [Candidatus Thermoplasmatota archaeon]